MGEVYKILNFITGDNLFTHVLPRACRFARPLILEAYPELELANTLVDLLTEYLDKSGPSGVNEWVQRLLKECPSIKPEYVLQRHPDLWQSKNPIDELEEMVPGKTIIIKTIRDI